MEIIVPVVVFVPLGVLLIIAFTRGLPLEERGWLISVLVPALLLRLSLAVVFVAFPQMRVFHEDAVGVELVGQMLATNWRGEGPPWPGPDTNWGYHYFAGVIYFVFGRFEANVACFNSVLGTMLAYLVYRLARQLFHEVVAKRAAMLVAFLPSMVLWGAMALKDLPITFLIVVSLSSCIALKSKVTLPALVGVFVPLIAIQTMRFYMIYFVLFAIIVALVLDKGSRYLTGAYRQLFLLGSVVGLFVLLGLADRAETDASQYLSLEYVSSYRRGMAATANSGFDADVDVSRPGAALAYLPIGFAHLLLAPFPWQMTSLRPLIAAPETIFWWTLFPATIRGIVFALRNRFNETFPLVLFSVTLGAAYSLIHGNIGSAFRQRVQILIFLLIFSSLGTFINRAKANGVDPAQLLRKQD
jgi:4-amino-4-deoxy-L-arabinose transferase-like glycosyltransferase